MYAQTDTLGPLYVQIEYIVWPQKKCKRYWFSRRLGGAKKLWVVPNANGKEFGALADPSIEVARMGVQAPKKRDVSGGRWGGEARTPGVRKNVTSRGRREGGRSTPQKGRENLV